jgi:hypothetical protein
MMRGCEPVLATTDTKINGESARDYESAIVAIRAASRYHSLVAMISVVLLCSDTIPVTGVDQQILAQTDFRRFGKNDDM